MLCGTISLWKLHACQPGGECALMSMPEWKYLSQCLVLEFAKAKIFYAKAGVETCDLRFKTGRMDW